MTLDDVDVALEHSSGCIRLSELSDEDLKEIKGLAAHIIKEGIFPDPYQSIIAAFHLFLDSYIETNEYLQSGRDHH
ncbi:MAG: hypothetical protein RLZZ181_1002 [Pseudomonadota bacterium]